MFIRVSHSFFGFVVFLFLVFKKVRYGFSFFFVDTEAVVLVEQLLLLSCMFIHFCATVIFFSSLTHKK